MLKENRHQDNAPATIAIGQRHTRALSNESKMKICMKHLIFEVIG